MGSSATCHSFPSARPPRCRHLAQRIFWHFNQPHRTWSNSSMRVNSAMSATVTMSFGPRCTVFRMARKIRNPSYQFISGWRHRPQEVPRSGEASLGSQVLDSRGPTRSPPSDHPVERWGAWRLFSIPEAPLWDLAAAIPSTPRWARGPERSHQIHCNQFLSVGTPSEGSFMARKWVTCDRCQRKRKRVTTREAGGSLVCISCQARTPPTVPGRREEGA